MTGEPQPINERRRRQIVREAVALSRETGLGGLTMRKVAARVGFSEAAAYRYFPSKTALLHALSEYFRDLFLVPAREILADAEATPREKLARLLDLNLRINMEMDGLPVLVFAELTTVESGSPLDHVREGLMAYQRLLEDLLAQMIPPERREACPGIRCLTLILTGLPAAWSLWCRHFFTWEDDHKTREQLIPFMVECFEKLGIEQRV